VSSNGQAQPGGDGAALAGLAREVEQLYRQVRGLAQLPQRVDELAAVLTQLADTIVAGHPLQPVEASPSWLDHPADPGQDPGESDVARDAELLLAKLGQWVAAVYLRYTDAGSGFPDCWMRHPDVVEELLWLHRAWLAAYAAGAAPSAVGTGMTGNAPASWRAFAPTPAAAHSTRTSPAMTSTRCRRPRSRPTASR
jgi:hypothetical protein